MLQLCYHFAVRKTRLFTPGPTPLIPEAQLALSQPLIHHRTPEFRNILLQTRQNLQLILRTSSDVVILASSGTGAMEAAVSNLHARGDKVLAVAVGKFGERWIELAQAFGVECLALGKDVGSVASPEEISEQIRKNPDVRSLLIQACETSTGTSHDLQAIARAVREQSPHILIIVDAISAIGSQPIESDQWGLDVVIGGAQKAFGIPPGLAFLSLSQRTVKALEADHYSPHYYLNLRKEVEGQACGNTAYTPAISLITALHKATQIMLKEGLEQLIDSAELMARCAREGLRELGFRPLSTSPANALTAAYPPEGVAAEELRSSLVKWFGIQVAGGQGRLKGKIIRVAHLGYFDILDVISVLAAIELCFNRMGKPVTLGKGIAAAMEAARTGV